MHWLLLSHSMGGSVNVSLDNVSMNVSFELSHFRNLSFQNVSSYNVSHNSSLHNASAVTAALGMWHGMGFEETIVLSVCVFVFLCGALVYLGIVFSMCDDFFDFFDCFDCFDCLHSPSSGAEHSEHCADCGPDAACVECVRVTSPLGLSVRFAGASVSPVSVGSDVGSCAGSGAGSCASGNGDSGSVHGVFDGFDGLDGFDAGSDRSLQTDSGYTIVADA